MAESKAEISDGDHYEYELMNDEVCIYYDNPNELIRISYIDI